MRQERRRVTRLVLEQPALALEAAAIIGEVPVDADEAVAGHDDRQRIGAVGGADGASRLRSAKPLGESPVAEGPAGSDPAKSSPDLLLERCAVQPDRQRIE